MTQVQKNNISAAAQRMLFRSSLPISTPRPLHEAHDNKPNKGCLTWSLGALVGKATRATDEAQAKRTPKQDGPARLSSRRPTGAFFFVFSFFLLFHRGKETKGTIEEGRGGEWGVRPQQRLGRVHCFSDVLLPPILNTRPDPSAVWSRSG